MGLIRLGIVSTAHINRLVIPGAQASDKVELIAVASREQSRAEEYARTWGIERAYGSYEALLEDSDVDAVYISLPNTMHCEWSIRALEAGKHVLCEKPFSRHPDEVEQAFDAAERSRPPAHGGVHVPAQPADEASRQSSSASGAIGELRVVRSAFSYSLYDADNIRLRTDVEGGSLMDVGCYCVSGSRLIAGEPESVFGQAYVGPSGTDWVFTGTMRFPRRRPRAVRLRNVSPRARRARGDRNRGLAVPRRPVALPESGDRAAPRRWRRAHRARPRGLVPTRAREPERRDPRRGAAPARPRGRRRPGADARGSAPLRRDWHERGSPLTRAGRRR